MVKRAAKNGGGMAPKGRATLQDVDVGHRVRAIRLERDMSQSALGQHLGVSFQQVQKYEKGTNRIAAGRLEAISEIFEVPISALFAEKRKPSENRSTLFDLTDSSGALTLLRAYARLSDPE